MCGIFGYTGKSDDAAEQVLGGLKLLEYRGYDSWGIAVKVGDRIELEKHVGKIGEANTSLPKSPLGIGHTRWATHGGVTKENAHPHLDCTGKIALLHNGIVENFAELKDGLLKSGHEFLSETDTEVVVHLIEENLKQMGFVDAVKEAFQRLKGYNAFVIAYAPSNEIVAVKTGSPLVLGKGHDGFYVASDASGIIKHTKEVMFLEDNQLAVLGDQLRVTNLKTLKNVDSNFINLDWEFEDAEKGEYAHFLEKEIFEQPRVLENIALNYTQQAHDLARLIENAFGTFMLGCGTASYACLAGTYLFSSITKRHVNFMLGSEFKYLEDYVTDKTLVIPISQSGETIDVVDPVEKARQKGATIAALVNVLGSTLYRQADFKLLLGAGQEKAVIATKSYLAMVSVLLLTAYTLDGKQEVAKDLLLRAAKNIQEILTGSVASEIKNVAQSLKDKEHIYVIGRGLSYATAMEASLKIKETTYVHAEGFAGGELKHGVIALIEKGTPCIVFAPNDETFHEIVSNAQEVKARGGYIIGIGPKTDDVFDVHLKTDDIQEATMLPQAVIAQVLAYHLALARGIEDPDKPRNLAKSVTVK